MQSNWVIVFSQLAVQSPVLIVYMVGLVVAAIYWRRARVAAMLAIMGLGLLFLATGVGLYSQFYVMNNRGAMTAQTMAQTMMVIGVVNTIIRALGTGLLVAAVFAQRPRVGESSGFDVPPAAAGRMR